MTLHAPTLHETRLEHEFSWLNPFPKFEAGWTWISHLPSPVLWLLLAATAMVLSQAVRFLPSKTEWQLPEHKKVHRFSILPPLLIFLPGLAVMLCRPGEIPEETLLLALSCEAITYAAIMDWYDRWIPDHVTVPMMLIGLKYHPLAHLSSSIDGIIICTIMAAAWFGLLGMVKHRAIQFDLFSGGDVFLAAAIGSWLGPVYGSLAIAIVITMLGLVTPVKNLLKAARWNRAIAAMGYDPETNTIPAGPYFAAVFCVAAICVPGTTRDLSILVDAVEQNGAMTKAAEFYAKQHPGTTEKMAKDFLRELENKKDGINNPAAKTNAEKDAAKPTDKQANATKKTDPAHTPANQTKATTQAEKKPASEIPAVTTPSVTGNQKN